MEAVLLILALIALVTGLVLHVYARKYPTELGKSIPYFNFQFWKYPPWRSSLILTPRGMELFHTSTVLILSAAAMYLLARLIHK